MMRTSCSRSVSLQFAWKTFRELVNIWIERYMLEAPQRACFTNTQSCCATWANQSPWLWKI